MGNNEFVVRVCARAHRFVLASFFYSVMSRVARSSNANQDDRFDAPAYKSNLVFGRPLTLARFRFAARRCAQLGERLGIRFGRITYGRKSSHNGRCRKRVRVLARTPSHAACNRGREDDDKENCRQAGQPDTQSLHPLPSIGSRRFLSYRVDGTMINHAIKISDVARRAKGWAFAKRHTR